MNKWLTFLLVSHFSLLIGGCDMKERIKLGEVTLPVIESIDYQIEIESEGLHRVSLEMTSATPIPKEILDTCKSSSERLCLIRELYGDMPWVLISENEKEVVAEGNYQSIDNRRARVLPLFTFKANIGTYKLTFKPSKGYSNFAPKVIKEIIIE